MTEQVLSVTGQSNWYHCLYSLWLQNIHTWNLFILNPVKMKPQQWKCFVYYICDIISTYERLIAESQGFHRKVNKGETN